MNRSFTPPTDDTKGLRFLYNTVSGRVVLKLLCAPWLSKLCGAFLSSRMSKFLILPFLKSNNIDTADYFCDNFKCFNDCFTRKIRPGRREFDMNPLALVAPCDAYLSAYKITDKATFNIKNSVYNLERLLKDSSAAEQFSNGVCLVFRLCVNHYHRYSFFDSGEILSNRFIKGILHTVRPIALEKTPVFCENSREVTYIKTDNFGTAAQIEVGAMLVGKIKNFVTSGRVERGGEKGMFLYGGSTVVLIFEKGKVSIDDAIFSATQKGLELSVRMGEKIGSAQKSL